MNGYIVSLAAAHDIDEVLSYLNLEAGRLAAQKLEDRIYELFDLLAAMPGLGHPRLDLTSRHPVHFFPITPYLIVYDGIATPSSSTLCFMPPAMSAQSCTAVHSDRALHHSKSSMDTRSALSSSPHATHNQIQ